MNNKRVSSSQSSTEKIQQSSLSDGDGQQTHAIKKTELELAIDCLNEEIQTNANIQGKVLSQIIKPQAMRNSLNLVDQRLDVEAKERERREKRPDASKARAVVEDAGWICVACGNQNTEDDTECGDCGDKRKKKKVKDQKKNVLIVRNPGNAN